LALCAEGSSTNNTNQPSFKREENRHATQLRKDVRLQDVQLAGPCRQLCRANRRYNKQLLRGADKLEELRTLAGQIRQHFYKITLPWSDEGFRLLPANFYFDLMARMREFEAGFEQGVESFLGVYPQYIEQVKPELNGLFREEDYPAVEKLRKKFGVKLEVLPIPSGADFRVQMSAEEQARVPLRPCGETTVQEDHCEVAGERDGRDEVPANHDQTDSRHGWRANLLQA
jgi:hypothetical protein